MSSIPICHYFFGFFLKFRLYWTLLFTGLEGKFSYRLVWRRRKINQTEWNFSWSDGKVFDKRALHTHTHTHTHTHAHTHTHTHTDTHTYTHIHTHTYIHKYTHIHTHIHSHICVLSVYSTSISIIFFHYLWQLLSLSPSSITFNPLTLII